MDCLASDVRILVVDDNRMSLKLAKNLFASFGVQVDCAESGVEALEMVKAERYQMIFMDYLMPEMDGIETTRRIRAMDDSHYKKVPIIALTGDEATDRVYFAEVGICDLLRKPLDRNFLKEVIGKWLPGEFFRYPDCEKAQESEDTKEGWPHLQGIDLEEGIKNSGGKEQLKGFFRDFYNLIDVKADMLEKCMAGKLIKEYTIEVHALKNSARIIGAMELSQLFGRMEQLGKAGDVEALAREHAELIAKYRSYKGILSYFDKNDEEKRTVSTEEMIYYLQGLQESTEAFDMDRVDEAMKKLDKMRFPKDCEPLMNKLRAAVADVAMENILVMSEEIISFLKYS